jgi:predicted nucleic acid-binding protein
VILCDVNVLLHAHKEGSPAHGALRPWLIAALDDEVPFGVSDLVLSAVVRIATNRRIFDPLAIEHDCVWVSTDRGFARFPGLRWRNPLEPES